MDICAHAVHHRTWTDRHGNSKQINLDAETVWTSSKHGVLKIDSGAVTCRGETMKLGNEIVDNMLELQQFKLTVRRERLLEDQTDGRLKALNGHIRLPVGCSAQDGFCQISGAATYIWKTKATCKVVKIRTIQLEREGSYLIDHQNKLLFKPGQRQTMPSDCGHGSYFLTEYSSLYLMDGEANEFEVVTEVDMALWINSRSDYVMFANENHLSSLVNRYHKSICESRYSAEHGEELLDMGGGLFARRAADVLYQFQCVKRTGAIKETGKCFDRIPLTNGKFKDPANKVMVRAATVMDCDDTLPLVVHSQQGWISVGKEVKRLDSSPLNSSTLHRDTEEHEDMSGGGLYSLEELRKWRNTIEFGSFTESVVETFASKVNGCADEYCQPEIDDDVTFDFNNLITQVNNVIPSVWDNVRRWLTTYGGLLSLLVLLRWTLEAAIQIALIALVMAKDGVQAAVSLLYSICCLSLYKRNKMRNKMKRRQAAELVTYHSLRSEDYEEPRDRPDLGQEVATPAVARRPLPLLSTINEN